MQLNIPESHLKPTQNPACTNDKKPTQHDSTVATAQKRPKRSLQRRRCETRRKACTTPKTLRREKARLPTTNSLYPNDRTNRTTAKFAPRKHEKPASNYVSASSHTCRKRHCHTKKQYVTQKQYTTNKLQLRRHAKQLASKAYHRELYCKQSNRRF